MNKYAEYAAYTDPVVGCDGDYEICYSDVYGKPLHDISYEDWLKYRSKEEGDSEGWSPLFLSEITCLLPEITCLL